MRQKYRDFKEMHKLLDEAYKAAQKRIEIAEESFNISKQKINTLEDAGGTTKENQHADLEHRMGKEVLIYARLDARLINEKRKQAKKNVERFEEIIPKIESNVIFSEKDFNARLRNISERETALKEAITESEQELSHERRKSEDEQTYANTLESLIELLNEAASYLPLERSLWEERRKLHLKGKVMKDVVEWHEKSIRIQQEIRELVRVKTLREQEHTKVQPDKEKKQDVAAAPQEVELQKEIFLRRKLAFDSLDSIAELLEDHLADLARSRNKRQIQFLKEKVSRVFNAIWGVELAVVQDRTITVGKTLTAIVLFIIGLIVLRLLIIHFFYFFLRKIRIREGISYTVSHLFFYVVLVILLFPVISYVGIPFHIFAFLGGALAIAAGFGAQKILSNFLSGVILLLEGSIQVGDMIQVDDTQGTIRSIGLRHIQLTTFTNVDILIPNSKFLEGNVINWTLRSDIIRSDIAVGVYFNAPPDKVVEILVKVAADHPKILDEPKPEAFIENINCDRGYLQFNVYYWLRMRSPRDRLIVESALRKEIIHRLNVHGIELASPTQDIVLHRA
jgi:potassium efflux system protein